MYAVYAFRAVFRVSVKVYYNSVNELKKYFDRDGENELVLREYLEAVTLMVAPVMPHVAEEFWSLLGKKTLVAQEKWPEANVAMINPGEEIVEDIVDNTVNDIRQGIELTGKISANKGKSIKEIRIIVSDKWKNKAYNVLAKTKNISEVMGDSELQGIDKAVLSQFLSQFAKKMNSLIGLGDLDTETLAKAFVGARDYLSSKFGTQVIVENEATSKSARAKRALPDKPSIDIIWG